MTEGISLLYKRAYPINDKISIVIPTVGEVLDYEQDYYSLVSSITAMPMDLMVQLDDAGIDFTAIDEYQLFQMMFMGFQTQDTSLVFGDLDLTKFEIGVNPQNEEIVFYDSENDIMIDRGIYIQIAEALRKINHLQRNNKRPGNEEARKYLLEKERRRLRKKKNKPAKSELEPLVIALVNSAECPYDYESIRNITIYQFNSSLKQVVKRVEYNNRMFGVYSGTVDYKSLSNKDMSWIEQSN